MLVQLHLQPLVVVTGEKTPIFNFLKDKNYSVLISQDRNVNFTDAIRKLANDRMLREELGLNVYNEIIKNYSKNVVVSNYINLLNKL